MGVSGASSSTPTYDELFDAARRLGTAELLLELGPDGRDLWLQLVRVEDGKAIYERPARDGVEEAAVKIRALVVAQQH